MQKKKLLKFTALGTKKLETSTKNRPLRSASCPYLGLLAVFLYGKNERLLSLLFAFSRALILGSLGIWQPLQNTWGTWVRFHCKEIIVKNIKYNNKTKKND